MAPAKLTRLAGQSELLDIRKALLLSGSSSRSAADRSRILEWSFCMFTRGYERRSDSESAVVCSHTSNLCSEWKQIIYLV